ncbi:uncharacterized protein LOC127446058 [Myxocyprinus asiaticus]|uniref:uncharacterized protein LOC127446058 n=1 Tax=Myxocyprinus asiaticus TaxID=70543 RepID=UPI0022235656|nr:uncharacterized protein LOC127446058 [Myxocyprinus asiaticus]
MEFPVLFLISSVSAAVGMVNVFITKSVISHCYQAITLHCNVSLSVQQNSEFQVTHFTWIKAPNETLCSESETTNKSFFYCHYTPNKQLVLTIAQPKPDDIGLYICKFRSSHGYGNAGTNVTLVCPQIYHIHEDEKNKVTCKVESSYHDGHIHWFYGAINLTSQSTENIYPEDDGSYIVVSSLKDSSHGKTYNCSYWVPHIDHYITSKSIMEHNNTQSFSSTNRCKVTGLVFCLCLLWTFNI